MRRRFRRVLARLAPPAALTARFVPWVTLALAAFAAAWSWFQFSEQVAIQRAQMTLSFHNQFLAGFPRGQAEMLRAPGDAHIGTILEIRCRAYAAALERGDLQAQEPLPDCAGVTLQDIPLLDRIGATAPNALRDEIRARVNATGQIDGDVARRMMAFFQSVRICSAAGQCDADLVFELFRKDMTGYLNATCALHADPGFRHEAEVLAQFLRGLIPAGGLDWIATGSRRNLFSCDGLRPIGVIGAIDAPLTHP